MAGRRAGVEGADKGAETAGLNVADEAELGGHKAKEDDAEVDKEADQEDQEDNGGLGQGDGGQVDPVDGGEVELVEADRDEGGGDVDVVTVMG